MYLLKRLMTNPRTNRPPRIPRMTRMLVLNPAATSFIMLFTWDAAVVVEYWAFAVAMPSMERMVVIVVLFDSSVIAPGG